MAHPPISRDWDYKRFREIADKVGAILLADIAHPALIAKKKLNDLYRIAIFINLNNS